MKLFIDCEWNSYKGHLISMALVPEDDTNPFYEVLECQKPDPWVRDNVMTKLYSLPISLGHLQQRLELYLKQFDSVHIIADWPEDIAYFCNALITGPGTRINTPPLTFEVIRVDAGSEDPHNALADARGLKEFILKIQKS